MTIPRRACVVLGLAALLVGAGAQADAQIEDQLSAYTGPNAEGYLQPLATAIGADLNGGLFHNARVPLSGFHFSIEIPLVAVLFAEEDATFEAVTESGFTPEQTVDAPTVVGSGEAVIVTGDEGTSFAFPGGFDLNSLALAVPQLRIGSFMGTEAIVRYMAFETGDADLGDLSLFGIGARHNINQYFGETFPVDLAGGFFWQTFSLGDDLLDSDALSIGVQASKLYGTTFRFEPYVGVSYDSFSADVSYESEASGDPEQVDFSFDSESTARLTLGAALSASFVTGYAEYNIAGQNNFTLGVSFGN